MLRPLLLTAALEGAEPGATVRPAPVPVVRYDIVAATRATRALHALADQYAAGYPVRPASLWPPVTAPAGGGWRSVVLGAPAPGSATR